MAFAFTHLLLQIEQAKTDARLKVQEVPGCELKIIDILSFNLKVA